MVSVCWVSEDAKRGTMPRKVKRTGLEGMAEGYRVFLLQKTWRGMEWGSLDICKAVV